MPELKYARYIITEDFRSNPSAGFLNRLAVQRAAGNYLDSTHMLCLNEKVLKGGLYTDIVWLWEKHGAKGFETEIAHSHDFDEILCFIGSRRDNPKDLNAEIEFWLADEKYLIKKSCVIWAPRNIPHCPLIFHRIDSPVLFFTVGNGTAYTRASGSEE
jgi:hypothetical protein